MNLIKTYFFVPANKPRFIAKSLELKGIDFRVLDFEDSVSESDIEEAIRIVSTTKVSSSDWVRIPLTSQFQSIAKELIDQGLSNIIIPKVQGKEQAGHFLNILHEIEPNVRVILLVENALTYLHLEEILSKWNKVIHGVGLGSHDFSASTGIAHKTEVLFPFRLEISLLANAYGVVPIDIASMNISDSPMFQQEIQNAYDLGYRAKFILHPFQLQLLNNYPFYSEEEVEDANFVMEQFNMKEGDVVVLKHKGKIYEKPHMANLMNIKTWGKSFYGTNR